MSIVVDMDMPKNCKECRWHGVNDYGNEYCKFMRKGFRTNDFVCPIKCDIEDIKAEIADRLGLLDCKKDILAIIDKHTK